ncbi:hypothetical protein SAMN02910325_00815 [Ruminococcus flavefaciens]|uniref:Uncharacterized protein n=1 Tax=Ruminococcus flavefaciens TaxID=1265 RepID=A0A315Y0R3_RUMFL|nr:hypothetical protein IE37_00815 [Ruminococcus flavefaciens]SSA43396.1 hypothetical protein SAMN02910325_00815 [Ruminococcus flavefaciens]
MIHDVFCLTRIRNSKILHNPFFGRRRTPDPVGKHRKCLLKRYDKHDKPI